MLNKQRRERLYKELRAKGIDVFELNARVPQQTYSVDALLWGLDSDGYALPQCGIMWADFVSGVPFPEGKMSSLLAIKEAMGLGNVFLFDGENWASCDRDGIIRVFDREELPITPFSGQFVARDPFEVRRLTRRHLAKVFGTKRTRDESLSVSGVAEETKVPVFLGALEDVVKSGVELDSGRVYLSEEVLASEALEQLNLVLRNDRVMTSPIISRMMVALAGNRAYGSILDPFVGLGGNLLQLAQSRNFDNAKIVAGEIQEDAIRVAMRLSELAGLRVDGRQVDFFSEQEPEKYDLIITNPVWGGKRASHELLDGTWAIEEEVIVVDKALRMLNPDGRLIVQLTHGLLNKGKYQNYRDYLSAYYRIGALIGLPKNSSPATSVQSVILVIDKAQPTKTFVANLADDWESQVESGTGFMAAAVEHLA